MDFISVNSRYGMIQVLDTDDLISNFLRLYGEWAWPEVEFVSNFVQPSSRVFDAGAYLGTFSMGLGNWLPEGELVVVEPNPLILPALTSNLVANCRCKYTVVNNALSSDISGKINALYKIENNFGSLSVNNIGITEPDNVPTTPLMEVAAVTLQELRIQYGSYDLLKLDIEGAEPDVLRSDRDWIIANRPVLWCECNESVVSLDTLSFLLGSGYHICYFAFPSFNIRNFNSENHRIFECAYEAGLLALPQDMDIKPGDSLIENQCLMKKVDSVESLREAIWLTPRWGRDVWNTLTRPELIALLGRTINRNSFADFLKI